MGHEMSHVILRHSTCNLSKQRKRSIWYSLGAIGSSIALGGVGGAVAAEGIGAAANLDFLRMSRTDEQQADLLGVRIAHDAGYDPRGLPQFFEIIQAKYGKGSAQFLSDHPSPGNRTEYVNKEIALLPPLLHPVKTSPQFEAIHQVAMERHTLTAREIQTGAWRSTGLYATAPGVIPPAPLPVSAQVPSATTPEGAYAPNQTDQRTPLPKPAETPQPSPDNPPDPTAAQRLSADQLAADSHLVTVPLPLGSIDAPQTWRATTQPDGSMAITPPGGAGVFGISYGVLIGTSTDKSTGTAALTEANDRLTRQLLKTHGLKPNGIASNLQVAGQPALARELTGTSPISDAGIPLPEHDWLITLARPDGTFAYLIFIAPQADFATLHHLYDSMLLSFKPN
jgi:beta-barrel assembly-enhancing protease